MTQPPEIVITGMGVISPIGIGINAFWDSLENGRSGIRTREGFQNVHSPFAIAAPVSDFDGKLYVKPKKSIKVMCRQIQFGFAAATMAVEHAGISADTHNPDRMATLFGGEAYYANPEELLDVFHKCIALGNDPRAWGEVAMKHIEPLWMLKYLPNMVASHISIAIDARGPSNSIVQGDNSSLLAIIEGVDVLQRGWADIAVVGATGSQMSETAMVYRSSEKLSPNFQDPQAACRPFDRDRNGTVAGEGAAAFVIETRESAVRRGARVYASIRSFDRGFFPSPEHAIRRIASSIQQTLARGNRAGGDTGPIDTGPIDIGHINANGSGVVCQDRHEAQAIAQVFGAANPAVPVFAPKSYFGNVGPASGALELLASLLAIQHRTLPGTLNYQNPDPDCPVHVLRDPQSLENPHALVINHSCTGQVASLLITGE